MLYDGARVKATQKFGAGIILRFSTTKLPRMKVETIKSDRMDNKAVVNVVYLFIIVIIFGNFILFWKEYSQIHVLSSSLGQNIKIYENSELRTIRSLCNKDPRLETIPPSTLLRIRSLKIQKKCKRGSRAGVVKESKVVSNGVNNNKLVKIKLHPTQNLLNLHIGTANMRSIRNKSTILHDYLIDQRLDAFLVTKTWL